ncbi:unnamed protein product [Moneuplotes crassus]|uniref:Uncharacterized protein n=1 Tax=Euplotes crassus TaxID=5936 RepID=A0AAD2D6F9_EUPCR|nr:unnamed protein product [Moneuplotes crassus]
MLNWYRNFRDLYNTNNCFLVSCFDLAISRLSLFLCTYFRIFKFILENFVSLCHLCRLVCFGHHNLLWFLY